jgi:hypothetical protein
MSNEHPILFNSEMVRAILDGRKIQTRRVIKLSLVNPRYDGKEWIETGHDDTRHFSIKCPYGIVGDRLWVRETFRMAKVYGDRPPSDVSPFSAISYVADNSPPLFEFGKVRPSIFMPRWASRLTLAVTAVKVERVQDISEEDAIAEGMELTPIGTATWNNCQSFSILWDSINNNPPKRPYGWAVNPWVWVVDFEVLEASNE